MNLYKSFGNLMEAWINEEKNAGSTRSKTNAEDPLTFSSDMEANPRSESVDSGVETASWDTACPTSSCSVSTNNAEADLFTEEPSPGSLIPSLIVTSCSLSSSPQLCTRQAETVSVDLSLKLQQALERSNFKYVKCKDEPDSQLLQTPFPSQLHTPKSRECQRSASLGSRQKVAKRMPEKQQRPLSVGFYNPGSENLSVGEKKELSPGLCYLEQVCQKLEEMARQQMLNKTLLMETNAKSSRDIQKSCERNSSAADEKEATCHRLENAGNADSISNEPMQRENGHLRQRSFSDANVVTKHIKEQRRIREQPKAKEENSKPQDFKKENSATVKTSFKQKFFSLRREGPPVIDTNSQQAHSPGKNSTRRRLSQLMRGRRKTQPI